MALVAAELDWAAAVERACADPESLRLAFQPVVDLRRGVVSGYETLARFAGPPDASPDRWFAAAALQGRSHELEARAIGLALGARDRLPANCFLTVNASPHALMSDELARTFAAAGSLDAVVVEITEQSPVDDYDELLRALLPLRAQGAMVAVDDAGAGYASLRHILSLRPDFVKVDRGLVSGLDADEAKAALIDTLGTFASRVDAWVVAEGVESPEEVDALVALGVPLGQGFGLSRPAPEMNDLPEPVAERIRWRARAVARRAGMAGVVEHVTAAGPEDGEAQVDGLLAQRADLPAIAILDARSRPLALAARDGERRRPATTVGLDDQVDDVLRRAMVRPPAVRFDPLVCCDPRGRYLGLVRVERLVAESLR
jgi:EAL domain-containing protein (putative c-di-GMP-specific phosphodiesterase class I)